MQYENNLRFAKKQRKQNVLFYTTSAASNPCVSFMVNMILRRTDFGVNNSIVTSIMLLTAPAREKTFVYKHWSQTSTFVSLYVYLLDFIEVNNTQNQSSSETDHDPWILFPQEVERNTRTRLVFPPTLLSCSSRFLSALQHNRAQTRLLYLF